jgi:hypothetical protein
LLLPPLLLPLPPPLLPRERPELTEGGGGGGGESEPRLRTLLPLRELLLPLSLDFDGESSDARLLLKSVFGRVPSISSRDVRGRHSVCVRERSSVPRALPRADDDDEEDDDDEPDVTRRSRAA